ncbi:nuclear matrix constituent protein 1-like [Gigantopelta aegis]|uniref:nuclear matrix constituent protein 1-like n=1 Tax=Gigantopelta aegis TaxID=1735272 RepID=UPI001B88BBFA|nr:nuclear matrix constituent protein 1-like [Gigantopelta aegis]
MSFVTKVNGSRNPELLIEAFDTWNSHYQAVVKEKSLLAEDLRQEKHEKERLLKSNEKFQNETHEMHKMIKKFHQQLSRLADMEDQNRTLKSEVKIREENIQKLNQKIQENELSHNKEQGDLKRSLEQNYENMKTQIKTEYESEKCLLKKQLADKENYISELENKINEVQKLKESELTKMSIEYENKLIRLQRQKVQTQHNPQNTASNEIFRKKLQHMKCEYEQEINSLKRTISSLQDRLSFNTPGQTLSIGRKRKL